MSLVIWKLLFVLIICPFMNAGINNNNDDKLVLSPVELMDMVVKEIMKKKPQENWTDFTDHVYQALAEDATTTELKDDESRLKNRKIWSRWGKWGECSVTCGVGRKMRERLCVSGRCARGEREEQLRPCERPPCADQPTPVQDAE